MTSSGTSPAAGPPAWNPGRPPPPVPRADWPRDRGDDLKALVRRSPRTLGRKTGVRALDLPAAVCHEAGWTARVRTGAAIRGVSRRLGVGWKRAEHWPTSPDSAYAAKKARDDLVAEAARHADWVLGFQGECRRTRPARPDLFAWAAGGPLRLRPNPEPAKGGGPAAAWYGVLRQDTGAMMLRFVTGRPVGQVTEGFLDWVCRALAGEGERVLVPVWDNAAWHVGKRVTARVAARNDRVARGGGCAIRVCGLPVKAPGLSRIEPKWVHGKRAVVEPDRKSSADEVKTRVSEHFGCPLEPDLKQAS